MIKSVRIWNNGFEYDGECDVCGAGPLEAYGEVVCSVPDPREGGNKYHQTHYDACLDCLKSGPENFPDRLREYARKLEEKAQKLLQLINGEWSSVPGQTYEDIIRQCERRAEKPADSISDDDVPF
jgi:hypothetical protein